MQESRNFGNTLSSGTGVDDLNFVIRDLQYSSVLDVPFYTQILHQLYSFFGKINVSVSAPAFLGYIYYVIFVVQSFLPAFLIDCEDIWPRESLMTMIMYVVGYVYQGPQNSIKSYRVAMSFAFSLVFIIIIIVLIYRAKVFQKIGRVASAETKFILFTFKYIMPLFCPHLMAGVAISFNEIINDKKIGLNIVQIIFSTVVFIFYIFLLHTVISPRVLLEDTPSHEWFPFLTVAGTINTTLLSLIAGIAGCVEGKNRAGCSIFMFIQSGLCGFTIFYINGIIKMIIGVVSSATCLASAVASLFVTIDLFLSKPLSPEILFVVAVIVYVGLIIVLRILKQMQVTKLLQFLDSLMDSRETARDILEQNYTRPFKILSDLRSVVEFWHPYLLTFEMFEFAISKWPDNFSTLILYARILSFFPNKNTQLMLIASMISKLPEKSSRNSYLYQFRHLARTRQTSMTKVVREKIEQINSKKEVTMVLMRQFWENILQKNIVNFWTDSDRVHAHISELDSILAQLIDDYPNNYKVLQEYLDFVQNIKRDHLEARDVAKKIETLKKNGQIKSDLALELALLVFPNLHNYLQVVEQTNTTNIDENEEENKNKLINNSILAKPQRNNSEEEPKEDSKHEEDHKEEESKNNEQKKFKNSENEEEDDEESKAKNITGESEEDMQIQCALSELTKRSKLGCIWFECIFVTLMTILSIVLFYLFYDYYVDNFVDKQTKAINFLQEIDMLVYELNFFTVNNMILPLTFVDSGEIVPGLSIENRDEYTRKIAPKLWDAGKIPPFSLSTSVSVELLTSVKERFSQMIVSLSLLEKEDEYVKQINHLFSEELIGGLYTVKDIATQELLIAQEVQKYTTPSSYFKDQGLFTQMKDFYLLIYQQFSIMALLSHSYASSSFDSELNGMNEKMILAILLTLLLVTLPYLLQLFLLKIQSDSIAESFTYFPNTEIRSIINRFGKSASKMDEDLAQVASLSHIGGNSRLSTCLVVLTFLSSFIVLIICSLAIYFTARKFIDNAASISNGIYTLSPAFASLAIAFAQCLRFYTITRWGALQSPPQVCYQNLDDNPFAVIGENMTSLLEQGIGMLFISLNSFSNGMWSKDGGVNAFFKDQGKSFDVFEDVFPHDATKIAHDKTVFEKIATSSFVESIDLVIGHLSSMLFHQYNYATPHVMACLASPIDQAKVMATYQALASEFEAMPALIYWFSNFSEINRTRIYFDLVEQNVLNKIGSYKTIGEACLIVVIIWQILACLFMILYMLDRNIKIKQSLRFYHFLKPEIILQNQNALKLIESGRQLSETNDIAYSNSDYIVSKIDQGVVVTGKNLSITNFNPSFAQKVQMIDENLNGKLLTDIIEKDENDKSWENFIQHVNDALVGRYKIQFSENISVQLKSGQLSHFHCTATCLTPNGLPNESEISSIEKVSFIFEDNTEIFMREQMINQEKKHLTDMLANVMPSRVVHNFEASGGEGMSFVVQSVSIGSIRVQVLKEFDKNTSDEFTLYNEIFSRFDEEIKEFDLLMKVHTFVHTYTYIGGLFSEVNKPERHAEESIRFALKLLKLIPELSEKFGAEIHLTFGVHTGGPVVAGVMSLSKPTFQIIGPISEMANQLKTKGVPDQICISRAVYELIFSAGFNVQERGDTTIRGGKVIPTYLVRL